MKDEPPIILRRTRHGLEALNAIDADVLDQYPIGSDVEVTFRKRRSGPQQRKYWVILRNVVDATGKWPTSYHLHEALKFSLGFYEQCKTLKGDTFYRADSTSFQKMDGKQFQEYFNDVIRLLSEVIGVDPMSLNDGK
jgi:hypothetical protein